MSTNFILAPCGECSVWSFIVSCNSTQNLVNISVSKCEHTNDYLTTKVDLDKQSPESCPFADDDFPKSKEELEGFLGENFTLIDDEETCQEFYEEVVICPQCSKSTEAGFGYEWNDQ